jgi:hypothetical protein
MVWTKEVVAVDEINQGKAPSFDVVSACVARWDRPCYCMPALALHWLCLCALARFNERPFRAIYTRFDR